MKRWCKYIGEDNEYDEFFVMQEYEVLSSGNFSVSIGIGHNLTYDRKSFYWHYSVVKEDMVSSKLFKLILGTRQILRQEL